MNNLTEEERERLADEFMGWKKYESKGGSMFDEWCKPHEETKGMTGDTIMLCVDWLNPNSPEAFCYQVHSILLPRVREMDDKFIYKLTDKITLLAMKKILEEKRFGIANYQLEILSTDPLTIARAILEVLNNA